MSSGTEFSLIAIMYNPISTGPGKAMAEQLKADIVKQLPDQTVELLETQAPRHAEQMAYDLAKQYEQPLVISASGDGGYNEVVNGLMKAQAEGATPVAGLLPSGNANDHFVNVYQDDVAGSIVQGALQRVDLLTLASSAEGKPFQRFAHSYIGFGLTPKVGKELNKTKLNRINEIGIVLNVLFLLRPVVLVIGGKKRAVDSLVCSNVAKMSKVLQLSDSARADDGKFEVTTFYRKNKLRLIAQLIKASTTGLKDTPKVSSYELRTVRPTLVQLDGEIHRLDSDASVTIGIEQHALTCLQ